MKKLPIALGALCALNSLAAIKIYKRVFSRYERQSAFKDPALFLTRCALCDLSYKAFSFPSGGKSLVGYYYRAHADRGTVVFSHGMHSGADDYLPIYAALLRRRYSVITYDGTGTYASEGEWTVGTCCAAQDLAALLEYISSSGEIPHSNILLMGHSLGAYAAAVCAPRFAVRGCVCISGMDLASSLIMYMARKYAGIAAEINRPLLALYQHRLFGALAYTSAVDEINRASCPVLIAHGECDELINEKSGSLISQCHRITNPSATFYVGRGKCGTHSGILYSAKANDMRRELFSFVDRNRDKSENDLCRILSSSAYIDYFRPICEVNEELMEKMPKF